MMKKLNLNRKGALMMTLVLLFSLGIGNAWGGGSDGYKYYYYAKVTAKTASACTGQGLVYVSTSAASTGSATAESSNATGQDPNNYGETTDAPSTAGQVEFYLYANAVDGYKFDGWSTSPTRPDPEVYELGTNAELKTTFAASTTQGSNTTTNPGGTANSGTDASNGKTQYYATSTKEHTVYAYFSAQILEFDVNFAQPVNGSITVNGVTPSSWPYKASTTTGKVTATMNATPNEGYVFWGYYTLNADDSKNYLSKTASCELTFEEGTTVYAEFIPNNWALFKVGVDLFYDLNLANAKAVANGGGTIVVTQDGILPPGNYTISGGVKLYIPYSTSESYQTTPAVVTKAETLSAYRTLTFAEGANVTVEKNGVICVGGKIMSAGGGNKSAYVTGPCGVINMANGGHIELNNGAKLYCWGFIKGQDMDQGNNTLDVGSVTANEGATIYQDFEVGDWRGGTATSNIYNNSSRRVFPFQSYSIQNIEVPTTFKYGSTLNTYVVVNGGGGDNPASFDIIGSKNTLFLLKDAQSVVRMWYDPTTDLTCYELSGTAQLDALSIKVYISMSSSDYNLPISNSMHIILTNCNMTLSKPMTMQAGSVIEIKEDATANLESNLYMFDKDDWGLYIHNYYFRSFNNLTSHKNRGAEDSNAGLEDAKLIVDGTLNITGGKGYLYSTTGGANVMGNGGGKVVFGGALASSGTLYQVTVNASSPYINWVTNAINTANLCNEDGSYTKSIASTTFHNVNGRWFTASAKEEKADHTYDFTYISAGQPVSGTSGTPTTTDAVYSNDKTGLEARMKWANVTADACENWWQGQGEQATWFYNYSLNSAWHQFIPMASPDGWFSGSDNNLYEKSGCTWNSVGEVDENCLYTIGGVKKALVNGNLIQLEKNTEDEAFHNTAATTEYYICFEGCNWHSATKLANEEKAYKVETDTFIWYNDAWMAVEYEKPFFYTLDETNVKVYYEYVGDEWVEATPAVKVKDNIETRYFYFIADAFTVANGKKNTTITLLKDIPTITTALTYSAKNTTCTLDLNGHILPGSISSMLKIDASGSTFTITDNSEDKLGRIQLTVDDNARRYCVNLTSGSLILNAGTISAINTKAYDKANSIKDTQSCGLIVKPGMTFTMDGGRIEAFAAYNPWGIYVEGSTTSGGTITINGGTVHSETTQISSPYGIYGYGTWNINSGATIEAVSKTTSACALYVEATTSKYFGTLNLKGGTINATSTTNTATGIFVNGVYIFTKTTPNEISSTYRAVANITGGTVNAITNGTTTAYGIQSRGTTTISNVTVNVTPNTTTGYGLLVQDGTTTINSGTFNINATTTAKGIYANGATPDDKTGRPYNPNVIVNGGVFNVTATTSTPSHGIYMDCNPRVITSTASGYYAGVYSSVPTVTVNGGEFYVRSTTKEAWGAYVSRNYRFETGTNTVAEWYRPTLTINDGTFEVTTGSGANAEVIRSYGITHVKGGDFTATAKTTYAYGFRVMDGIGTTSGNPKFTVKATTTNAYGAVADITQPGEKTGLPCQGDLTIGGGTFDVNATTSDAYGIYVNASGRVVTSTADGYYPGDYSSIGRATVNGGTFAVTTQTLNAIGVYVKSDIQANRYVTYGELTINDGNFTVATSVHTKNKIVAGVMTYGPTTINGGTFDVTAANSSTATNANTAYGVYALDDETTISGSPEFTVKSYSGAYGVTAQADAANATTGLTNNSHVVINSGTFNVSTTGTTTACGVYAAAPTPRVIASGDYAGDYYSTAELTVNGGTFNVVANTTTAIGAMSGRNYISANTMPNTFSNFNYGVLNINGGTFNVSTLGTTTAEGVRSHGTTTISGGTFNVTPKTTTAFGVRVYAGTTIINNNTEMPTFTVTATESAYGIRAGEQPADKTGLTYNGTAIINAGLFTVEATSTGSAYGLYAYANRRKVTSTSSGNYIGAYASAGNITANGGEFDIKATTNAYGIMAAAKSGYAAFTQSSVTYPAAYATPQMAINDGKFKVTSTSDANATAYATNASAAVADYGISGGYYNINTNLSKYAVSPKKVITLRPTHSLYPDYQYTINEGGTVTWKNGSTTLKTEMYESDETPAYTGDTPTQEATAQYSYTHNGWDPTVEAMANADQTYTATFSQTENKYTVSVAAGANGSVSPASVSNIGCETASGDITATPNAGYNFVNWTLQEGVTPATGYTANSNPIRIHATAADKTITANFVAGTVNYTVKHMQQNIADDNYTEFESETKQGTTATTTAAVANSYPGFTAQPIDQVAIAGDGSTVVNIYYNRNTYTITWVDGNGTTIETDENVKYGATPSYDGSTPTKTATAQYTYSFSGWDSEIVAVTEAKTYTAHFSSTPNPYTLTWDVNGGDDLTGDYTHGSTAYGTTIVKPADPTKTGYTFADWTPSVATTMPAANTTYTATWTPNTNTAYTVKHYKEKLEGGYNAEPDETDNLTGTTGAEVTPAVKNYPGFTAPEAQTVTILADGSRVVEYYYLRKSNKVTWNATENGGSCATEYTMVKTGATIGTLPVATKAASIFTGWFTEATGGTEIEATQEVTADVTYFAQFVSSQCTITWRNYNEDFLGTSTIQPGGTPGYSTVQHGVPTRVAAGGKIYEWDGWTTEPNGAGTFYAKDELPAAAGDATYYAHFRIKSIEVEASDDIDIDEDTNVETTIVHVQGALTVAPSATLTTQDLILEATPGTSGEIIGTVEATEHAYFDLSNGAEGFKARTWYAVAVPWQVAVPAYDIPHCGVYITNDGEHYTQQELGSSFDLIYYDGALRAAQGPVNDCWRYVEDDASDKHIMYPGRAYMIYLTSDAQTIRFERKSDADLQTTTLAVDTWGTGNAKDMNWNGIANPATYHAYINANAGTYQGTANAGQIYHAESRSYSVVDLSQYDLVVGQPVFVQATAKNQSVAAISSHNVSAPYYAPRRSGNWTAPVTRYTVSLAADEAEASDRVIVCMDEDKEQDTYVIGQDLMKMGVSSVIPQLYINRYDGQMCVNTAAPVNNRTDYPLGIYVPQAGAYNLFINDQPNDETMLYLTLDGEIIWNLSYGGFVVNLDKGTTNRFGLRMIASAPQVTTGVEEALINAQGETRKVLINDKVFIIRGNNVYSADGQLVK